MSFLRSDNRNIIGPMAAILSNSPPFSGYTSYRVRRHSVRSDEAESGIYVKLVQKQRHQLRENPMLKEVTSISLVGRHSQFSTGVSAPPNGSTMSRAFFASAPSFCW